MARSIYSRLHRKYGESLSGPQKRDHYRNSENEANDFTQGFTHKGREAPNGKSVVVIGGGFAGLSAAYHLSRKGFKITLLEARPRFGGRVHSLHNFAKGQIIEAGAELIGTNHGVWIKLARQFGLSFNVVTQDELFNGAGLHQPLYLNGKEISSAESARLYNLMDDIYNKLTDLSDTINKDTPWTSPNAAELDKVSLANWLDEQIKLTGLPAVEKKLLRDILEADLANNNAVPTKQQSLLGMLALVKAGGGKTYWAMTEVFRCSTGNDSLAITLKDKLLGEGYEVLENTPVKEIKINKAAGVQVITANHTYKADYAVLAIPPSVWNTIKMDKQINNYKSQMGVAVKYLSTLKNRFWIKSWFAPSAMADNIGMTWEGTDNQIIRDDRQIELTVFAGGPVAKKISAMTEAVRKKFYTKHLDELFTWNNTPIHHGYSKAVIDNCFQNWPTKPWTMAGYSFPNVNEVCTKIKAQNEGYQDRLFFAGEHTCLGFVGYMEGALRSGITVTKKIASVAKAKHTLPKNR